MDETPSYLNFKRRRKSHTELPYASIHGSGTLTKIADLPISCSPNFSVFDAAKLMSARRAHCIIVTDEDTGKMVGLVTAKDMAFRVVASDLNPLDSVTRIMTSTPYCVPSYTSANDALRLMVIKKIRHLPLMDDCGIVVGLLNITKCFYHAMIRLEKMSDGARRLQCTFEDLNDADESAGNALGSKYSVINRSESSAADVCAQAPAVIPATTADSISVANEELFDLDIRRRKMSIAHDLKRLIEILKQPELRDLLSDDVLHIDEFAAVDPAASIWDAAKLLKEKNITAALICKSHNPSSNSFRIRAENVIGILTTKDILFRVLASNYDANSVKVARVMTPRPNFADESMGIHTALRLMYEGKYLNLPIVNTDGFVTGLVNVLHLTNALLKALDLTSVESSSFPYRHSSDTSRYGSETDEGSGPAWNKFWGSLDEPLKSLGSSERLSIRSGSHNLSKTSDAKSFASNMRSSSVTSIPLQQQSLYAKRGSKPSFSSPFNPLLNPSLSLTDMSMMTASPPTAHTLVQPGIASAISKDESDAKILRFKLKVRESMDLNLDGKIYKVKVTVDAGNRDEDLLSIIKEKIFLKLELSSLSNCLFDFGYIDDDNDLVALDKNEDLEAALEFNLSRMLLLVLTMKEKSPDCSGYLPNRESHVGTNKPTILPTPNHTATAVMLVSSIICGTFLFSRLWAPVTK
ncbi:hypothetical protein FOA43_000577 [Brettanomyces nanus]|uniref:CBS domain-containing protein n=1 Tax=Eeniella nana TaxID=13502 RepID=A0A875S052_EENNA|nr:uncharacterized protein FOA43_000577 [Brettanomyces nanus]QPG73269.1 hypothetical protein FOA43_000577 [Brettanomyces nanus]